MFQVVVAGIPRSGSTFLFNAARVVMERQRASVQSGWVDDYSNGGDADASLIKVHDPNVSLQARANRILLSHRDLRDIASSVRSMGWAKTETEMVAAADAAREMHDFWSEDADLDLPYDLIHSEPVAALNMVAAAVGVPLADGEAHRLAAMIPSQAAAPDSGGYDRKSLLHAGHITDGRIGRWKVDLPYAVADAIWVRHGDWLQDHGYGGESRPIAKAA